MENLIGKHIISESNDEFGISIPETEWIITELIEDIGAQGVVYKVKSVVDRKIMIYKRIKTNAISNLQSYASILRSNIQLGSPGPSFIWPIAFVESKDGIGYIMRPISKGYVSIGEALVNPNLFGSWRTVIDTCINIAYAFWSLHKRGQAYLDISSNNIFVDTKTGQVEIIDCDSCCFDKDSYRLVKGSHGYISKHVLNGGKVDRYSDLHAMAVMFFQLILSGHPLDQETDKIESLMNDKEMYGIKAKFRFCKGIDACNNRNMEILWNSLPYYIKQVFCRSFSDEVLNCPRKSVKEREWIFYLSRFKNQIVTCPHCGGETFSFYRCDVCDKNMFPLSTALFAIGDDQHQFYPQKNACISWAMFERKEQNPEAAKYVFFRVEEERNQLFLKNISGFSFEAITAFGPKKLFYSNTRIPIEKGISFNVFGRKLSIGSSVELVGKKSFFRGIWF